MSRKTALHQKSFQNLSKSDLGKIHAELSKRGTETSGAKATSAAETATVGGKSPVASAGFRSWW